MQIINQWLLEAAKEIEDEYNFGSAIDELVLDLNRTLQQHPSWQTDVLSALSTEEYEALPYYRHYARLRDQAIKELFHSFVKAIIESEDHSEELIGKIAETLSKNWAKPIERKPHAKGQNTGRTGTTELGSRLRSDA